MWSAGQRGRIASLNLLAMLCLMQPRTRLAFPVARADLWLIFDVGSTSTPGSSLQSYSLAGQPQQLLVPGAVPHQVQRSAFPPVDLLGVPVWAGHSPGFLQPAAAPGHDSAHRGSGRHHGQAVPSRAGWQEGRAPRRRGTGGAEQEARPGAMGMGTGWPQSPLGCKPLSGSS